MRNLMTILLLVFSVGAFAQSSYTFVFLHKKEDADKLPKEKVDSIMQGHMANMKKLAGEGKLLAAGPFHGGGGIFIFATTNLEEAAAWIDTDPGIQAKRWNVEIQPYTPRYGDICPVGEQYEMTTYSFIRFNAIVTKFTAATYPQIIKKHDEYLKQLIATGNVVTEAIFGPNDGGIMVMKGNVEREIFENDPGVQEDLIELDIKKLYIAKGSFCEK